MPFDPARSWYQRLIVLSAVFTLLTIGLANVVNIAAYRFLTGPLPGLLRVKNLQVPMLVLDEALTRSAQLFAATGDPAWEARHGRLAPRLARVFEETRQLRVAPAYLRAARQSDLASQNRAGMDARAFELVRQGQRDAAQTLLSGEAYQAQKRSYAAGMAELDRLLRQDIGSVQESRRTRLLWSLTASAILTPLLILGWGLVLRGAQRWQTAIVAGNREMARKTADLAELNSQLDLKVGARTKELSDSAAASLNMMEDAIRQREASEEARGKLDYLASYDALTGLANQSLFLKRLRETLLAAPTDRGRKAVFVLDIERFKSINDVFGRAAGDSLLRQIVERMVRTGGGDASRFARIGSNRFAIVAADLDSAEQVSLHAQRRLVETFQEPFPIDGSDLRVAVKTGIAVFSDDGTDADTLLRNAEAALKRAKESGDPCVLFRPEMSERIAERLSLENGLRRALGNDEFVLHYQPKVSLAGGEVAGAEALIRWNDPRTGLVLPGRFIPILEDTGLIHDVGRWALLEAIQAGRRWRAAGLDPVPIAVNVSPLQLRHRSFVADLEQAIGGDPRVAAGLEVEITESVIMQDVGHAIATLRAIRAMGIGVAIDDFGTGFSSLSVLSKLPVSTLKIDRSFVAEMTAGPEALALVSTIIGLAHALKLKVVAEGVESEEQARLLRLVGCDEMQGYLYDAPMPAAAFADRYLARRRAPQASTVAFSEPGGTGDRAAAGPSLS